MVQWLGLGAFTARVQVQSLVGEQRKKEKKFQCWGNFALVHFLCCLERFLKMSLISPLLFPSFYFLLFFFFLAMLHSLQDLVSPTRDWTRAMAGKAWNSNHRATRQLPKLKFLQKRNELSSYEKTWRKHKYTLQWPSNNSGLRALIPVTPHAVKNLSITSQSALHIHISA